MFSEEMMALGKKSSVIREIFEYSKKRKAEIGADKVYDFSLGNPSIPAPEEFNKALISLITEGDSVELHGYTSAVGDNTARQTIAENIEKTHGFHQPFGLIYMTCGAAASLTVTIKALVEKDEEVILLAPYFPEYQVFVKNALAVPVTVLCNEENFRPDIARIEAAISEKTRAIIINSPNNPTGVVFSKEDIKALSELLEKKSREFGKPIVIIADEPYRALVYGGVEVPYIPTIYKNTVVCTSYSKSLSIPGERIGYIAVSPELEGAGDLFAAICGAGRSMGYVCAPSLFQRAAAMCDSLSSDVSAYDKNRTTLYNALSEIGYTCLLPEGAFYLFVKALDKSASAFCEAAKKHELLIVPSESFGVEGWVRIAYCVTHEQIEKSIPAFKALFDEYKEK